MQDILEMNLSQFRVGGMNITGFSHIDPENSAVRFTQDKWLKSNADRHSEARERHLQVNNGINIC